MKAEILVVLFVIKSFIVFGQAELSQDNFGRYSSSLKEKDYWQQPSFKIGGAVLIPMGKLKEFTGVIPVVDLGVDVPLKNNKAIGLNIQYGVPEKTESFLYEEKNEVIETQIRSVFNVFVNFKKNLFEFENTHIDFGVGIGVSSFNTNVRNPDYDKENNNNKYESITALLFSPGIEFKQKVKKDEFSISMNLQYSPYRASRGFVEDMGSFFMIPKIAYRF